MYKMLVDPLRYASPHSDVLHKFMRVLLSHQVAVTVRAIANIESVMVGRGEVRRFTFCHFDAKQLSSRLYRISSVTVTDSNEPIRRGEGRR